jgi:NhaA family Na+:H+ antiporter
MTKTSARTTTTAVLEVVFENSLLLLFGALAALIWANLHLPSYEHFAHAVHFVVNDIGMVFFFALAAKEVYEATLPGGPLSSPRQAMVPIFAAVGGMVAPALMYIAAVLAIDRPELVRGWAIPCATDIAFSYLVARIVFPKGHPAIPFLLLLAIADDALGLIVLAVFYPSGPVSPGLLAAWMLPALVMAWALRRTGTQSFWAYVLGPGVLSWMALHHGGIHPALAMVPVVPFMPHARSDLQVFGRGPVRGFTTLHDFEHWWRIPVQFVLLAFGLANAGVPLTSVGSASWIVAGSLILGKPIGILGLTALGIALGFRRAPGLDYRSVAVLGVMAGIGFTVALFFTTAAFEPGGVLDEAKMGALLSFFAAPIAVIAGRLLLRSAHRGGASA